MKIFITGGTGFIGRHTVGLLIKRNYKLTLLVRKSSNTSFLKDQSVSLITGSITNKQSLLDGMKDCDTVINLAGHYSFWEPDKKIYSQINIEGAKNVFECALESGIKKIIHISTAGVFGIPNDKPFNEESTPGPIQFSEYFRTKYEGDQIA